MRRGPAVVVVAGVFVSSVTALVARAQAAPPRVTWADTRAETAIEEGRERMRRGDCAGALDAFDQALASSMDPTVRRDRGLCHERLGHAYPAVEDLRAYVAAAPDAADADAIRDHIQRLSDDLSGAAPAGPVPNDDIPPAVSALDAPEPASPDAPGAATPAVPDVSGDDEVPRSSLRGQAGFGLAPFFVERKWIRDGRSFADGETWSEILGLEIRYSFAGYGALLADVGYEIFDTTDVDAERVSGVWSLFGFELRVPVAPHYDDQITITPGVGYEYFVYAPSNTSVPGYAEAGLSGRMGLGYRHMVGPSGSLDVAIEGGPAWFLKVVHAGDDAHAPVAGFAGLRVALSWGL